MGCSSRRSYVLTRDLSDAGRRDPTAFCARGRQLGFGQINPRLDYGNVMFDRRHRLLATFLYQLPFGKGQTFLPTSGRLVDAVVGGWQLGGVTGLPERAVPHRCPTVGRSREHQYP